MDERLKWMEVRISSSLRPRNEDLKNMMTQDDNRLAFYEFVNNEDVKRLFVYMRPPRQITASLQPPHDLKTKSIFFMKSNPGTKLTKDNMDNEVFYMDCTSVPLEHLELTIREVFLPLLGTNTPSVTGAGINGDKLMDIMHRLMAAVEVSQGHVEGRIVLNLPSIEVLAEVAASPSRRASVLHVLETTVIGWIKQIRGVLRHDPQADLARQAGQEPGPLDEVAMWESHLSRLRSIDHQLDSDVAKDILHNLQQADSQYAHSFQAVRKDIAKAEADTKRILKFLGTMKPWFQQLHDAFDPKHMLTLFKPLMTVLNLVWSHSVYYHQIDKFHNLLRLLSNEVVHRAIALVGENILREPLESYSKLKEALRVCAAFRGTYLDFKDKADDKNAQNIAENAERLAARPQGTLFTTKMYGPHAYTPRYGLRSLDSDGSSMSLNEEDLMTDSPWPPRNAPCFDLLNSFMERCNDVLELVETTRHFRLLAGAAEIGGAGSMSLDAMVKEIHQKYSQAMSEFFSVVSNVLNIDGTQSFERAFFKFRTVVKSLEKRLSGILRQSFMQCPTVESQLRLLEVFEGVSGREMVQLHLKDKDRQLVYSFSAELQDVRSMFSTLSISPPLHSNMPPVVSKLMWVYGLKQRIKRPMEKLKQVSPHSLDGDTGWQMRDTYSDLMKDLDKYENDIITEWQSSITADLTLRLKQPLLIAEEYDEETEERPQVIHVNLDPRLLLLLREIRYISQPPFNTRLPPSAKELVRNTSSYPLSVTATRLETIVSNYNSIMRTLTAFEKPMFERKLAQIDTLLEQGLQHYTWRMTESADFIETAMALVCMDVHQNLDIVQTGCHDIAAITISWSGGMLDVFTARRLTQSYSMEELLDMQKNLDEELENLVVPSGNKIHCIVQSSFEVVQISQASPAWQDYIDYIDAIVLDGLKQSTLSSLRTMLNTLVQANMVEPDREEDDEEKTLPILTIRLELIENSVAFRPPLDQNSSVVSVQELVARWLAAFVARGRLVKMLGPKGSYEDYISADEEVKQLLSDITQLVEDNAEECKKLLEVFKEYAFLWQQDVNQTFEDFLSGMLTPNPLRSERPEKAPVPQPPIQTDRSSPASRASSARSAMSQEVYENAERTFLTPKGATGGGEKSNVPSLDEFDNEIDIYRTARDEIDALEEHHFVGWLRVDLQPIKQVLTTYASKWMWTFTKYLSDQVTAMLENLDMFLKRIEPEIESITGEERDTASFMKMMRLFNEVSAQQSEMDGKFAAMHRTVLLLKKYGQILPEKTQYLFSAAPGRWSNLKTKVSKAKQRLGPRIQEESASISHDLETFSQRVLGLQNDLENSDVYNRECSVSEAYLIIDNFSKRLVVLENEAQDLIELQELLEANVVNFNILPTCRHELNNLKQVWETTRVIDDQQSDWKRHRWQKMNTKFLREESNKQLEIVKGLPDDVLTWDVYMGLHESITTIQACLPLIDDLSNPAMRTRHWKQLVRVTGGAFTIDNDTLKRMTLRELLSLGLQKHVDDVRAIVQRAVKDLAIEMSLKTYEEVWLSKIFEMRPHTRNRTVNSECSVPDNQSEYSQSEAGASQMQGPSSRPPPGMRTTSRISNQSSHSKNKRSSISSLPASLLNLGEDSGQLNLLKATEPIFEELEHHQVTLQAMQSNSAAGSFLDEVLKWQKKLQTIEAVLTTWLDVQEKWIELEEVYTGADVRAALAHDANRFAMVNKDFRLLMRATEKNPNVLQCCTRKNILKILEHMNDSLDLCRKSLLNHLERRRQIFPRFYFLSMEDVLHIVCNGYDLNQVNMYISKLFEHLGSLVFEEVDDNDKYCFIITGVDSALGERLHFQQPVPCEGQIETWLTSFLNQLKVSLQQQLATAMGVEKPTARSPSKPDERKSSDPGKPASSGKKDSKSGARSLSRVGSRLSQREPVPAEPEADGAATATSSAGGAGATAGEDGTEPVEYSEREDGGRSWTLEHVSEVVYLATQIQMSSQIQESLAAMEGGDHLALEGALEKIDAGIQGTILLLKGLEGEKEFRISRQKQKTETEGLLSAREGEQDDSLLDLTGARSLTSLHKASTQDLTATGTVEETRTPPPDDNSTPRAPGSDAQSAAPVDTMNISLPVMKEVEETVEESADRKGDAGDEAESEEMKLMLFPSQIHKLTCLLSLLSHLRDLVQRLMDMAPRQVPVMSFDWRSQLLYSFVEDTRGVTVHCMKTPFEYGFEYLGSSNREVLTPQTERMFVAMTQAIKAHTGALCMGPKECGKFDRVRELSLSLGRPLYVFNCTTSTNYLQIHDIFRGLASTGCWVSFTDIDNLQLPVLSVLAQLMNTVMAALRQSKAAVHLQSDDVQLNKHSAIFALMDSAIPVTACDPEKPLLYPAPTSRLPDTVRELFRVVSMMTLDFQLSLEVMLFSEGFVHGRELARKTQQLYTMCRKMFGTNTSISDKAILGQDNSGSYYGWSLHSLKGVVSEAGAHLADRMGVEEKENIRSASEIEKHENEVSEKERVSEAAKKVDEETSLVTALRDTFVPRMNARDASLFATLMQDLWLHVDVPMVFGGEEDSADNVIKPSDSLQTIKSELRVKSSKSHDSQRSLKDSLNLNTPVVPMLHASKEHFGTVLDQIGKQVLEDMQDAIAVATGDLGLLPGAAFQARVMQLAQLNAAHQTILVVGPSGCGKSECIKTFAVAEKERGKIINIQSVFTKAVESQELMGYVDPKTKDWQEGLLTSLLRKFCIQPINIQYDIMAKPTMKIMQLDGECDPLQMELLFSILNNSGTVVLANNERLTIPPTLRFVWEMESLEAMTPSMLASVGVLVMSESDVGWKLMLVQWLEHRNEGDKDLLTSFCDTYIQRIIDYVSGCTKPEMFDDGKRRLTRSGGGVGAGGEVKPEDPRYTRCIQHSVVNMINTFMMLLEALTHTFTDLTDVEYERYFSYTAVWAFGGTLDVQHRESFSNWWRSQFDQHIDYPADGTVFDYVVDNETHNFCKWSDLVPSYTGTPHSGIPHDAFVHTVHTEQLLHLVGVLTDAGRPVMLVGENGCGKTAIINERIRTVCSGEVAEVLSLTVYANRFTNARLLFDRLDERLEWKHGRTHVPKGNKRLLCLIDDINLSQVDSFGHQTACELVREHLDDGGFYSPSTHTWRYVKNVTYVTTINPRTTANTPKPSHRLLRHFAIFGCPYPGDQELQTVFTTLLGTHFFTPETSGSSSTSSSAAQHLGISDDKVAARIQGEDALRGVIASLVWVTVELNNRLRTMFLPTAQRCHYIFTARDLANIFRNMCLSLHPNCDKRNLLLLWQHECYWVYGRRMVNEVDIRRFRQAFITAVRKQFIDDDLIQTIVRPRVPLFSNLMEQDSGVVTAGMIDARSSAHVTEEDARTDLYKPARTQREVTELLEKGVEEYNKIHPRIRLALYKSVVEQVCRLSRTMASPHEGANTVLVAEGCPARTSVLVKLSAHLCGYTIFQPSPTPNTTSVTARLEQFKSDLVMAYTRAGAKGEKLVLLIHEEELVTDELLVYLTEFIVSCCISHLFTNEEMTTIINSIRTEVTQAGLTYTRDVAWNFFLRTVRNNCRVCLIVGNTGSHFQRMCRQYPAFTKNVNYIWFQHWSKSQLVEHASFHLKCVDWMTAVQRENVAHMLASMHLVLRQQDGGEKTTGEYGHVTNTTYEKFVEKFISLANERHSEIEDTHNHVTQTLDQIRHENEMAIKLKKQLEHEMIVLEERKAGTIKILSQIGQDTAITEQQIRVVKNQLEKIERLKKLLPEYQVAHERAVYKAIAIVADTKKVVKVMDREKLAELRAMSKPSIDIEDLMASIIMILKSPTADLTWQKGAKRQMANLDRFIDEELMTFDDSQLPESTLVLVEPYLKKPSFDPEAMERKTGNSACGSLCRWVRGVVRYHRMMLSKVKPLHQKVDETTQAVDNAQHKMNTLESKRKALEVRLADLARGFEEATIDKNEQEEKTVKMKKILDTAAQLRRILRGERQRAQQVYDSYKRRLVAVPGGCAMAGGFATYLGPYHHNFRRVMLTVHWPSCLRERGVPLVIDSVDVLRGRVIDWSINFLKTASGASSVYEVDFTSLLQGQAEAVATPEVPPDDAEQPPGTAGSQRTGGSRPTSKGEPAPGTAEGAEGEEPVGGAGAGTGDGEQAQEGAEKADEEKAVGEGEGEAGAPPRTPKSAKGEDGKTPPPRTPKSAKGEETKTPPRTPNGGGQAGTPKTPTPKTPTPKTPTPGEVQEGGAGTEDAAEPDAPPKTPKSDREGRADATLSQIPEEDADDDDAQSQFTESSAPILTTSQYTRYVRSLIKILVGETTLNDWIRKDFGPRQLENAAILCASWQRLPMLIDPNGEGEVWLGRLNKLLNRRKLVSVDMENRTDPHIILTLERAITKGKPVLIRNCDEVIDNFITPLIHHRNTSITKEREEDPRMILFCGRRTLCHQDFRFSLSTRVPKPRFSAAIASSTTLVNFGVSNDTLIEDLLARTFARIRPDLHRERITALRNLQLLKDTLHQFSQVLKGRVLSAGQQVMLNSPKALQFITDITQARLQLANELAKTQSILNDLDVLKDELYPVARRGALLFSLMKSLASVRHEYQFSLPYFLQLFDEAVGGELPKGFGHEEDEEDGYEAEESVSDGKKTRQRPGSLSSQHSVTETAAGGRESGETKPEAEGGATGTTEEAENTQQLQPEETDVASTTASTGAANKLMNGSDSEDLPPVDLPDTVQLPSEGVEYASLSLPRIKQLMSSITTLSFHRVKQSLMEEDHLLFRTLLCLNIQLEGGEDFTQEEMSLFLQGNPGLGMQLTLSDFDSKDSPPAWLGQDKWEDILALSVLPGPMDSLCVSFAAASEEWHQWFTSPYPELMPLPLADSEAIKAQETNAPEGTRGSNRQALAGVPDMGPLNEFHQLLILRMLRPDRLPTALARYTDKHLNLYDPLEDSMNIAEVMLDARSHLGVLLLLPTSASSPAMVPESRLKLTSNPVDVLCAVAKSVNIHVERVMVGDGTEYAVEDALHQADKKDQWVIVEGLHLAPPAFFFTLRQHLQRIHKSRASMTEEQLDASHFCVWMTCKIDSDVPDHLISRLHKVSWAHVLSMARPFPNPAPDAPVDTPLGMQNAADATSQKTAGGEALSLKSPQPPQQQQQTKSDGAVSSCITPQNYLREAIITALRQVPLEVWEEIKEESALIKALAFAMTVIQGCLLARQLFGSAGLNRWYPLGTVQVVNAIWFLVGRPLLTNDGSEPGLDDLCHCVGQLLYGSMVINESDGRYITALTREVLEGVYRNPSSDIVLGSEIIPTPPPELAPLDYPDWFEKNAPDNITLGALQLHTSIEQEANDASAHRFITSMFRMHETQSLETGDITNPVATAGGVDLNKLRSALDICTERLPAMLELGQVPQLLTQEFNFPYHRPSIISMSSASSDLMPESIGYVLLQECLWMNHLMCHVRQQIHELQTSMVGGAAALPRSLLSVVLSVQEELVPVSWIHPNSHPCTHSLTSWLDDLVQRHRQLQGWVKRRMVPIFDQFGHVVQQSIARGRLTSVWLGGLVNPQALLTAMRQEKAVLVGRSVEQIELRTVVLNSQDVSEFDVDDGGLFVNDIYLQGADWNFKHDRLEESKSSLFHIKCLYICPIVKPDPDRRSAEDREDAEEEDNKASTAADTRPQSSQPQPEDQQQQDQQQPQQQTEEQQQQQQQQKSSPTPAEQAASPQGKEVASPQPPSSEGKGPGSAKGSAKGQRQASQQPPSVHGDTDERDETALGIYNCPVYINKSRQMVVCTLPLNCPCPEEKWTLANAAFILDRGLPEGASKKSRSYMLLQRLPAAQRQEGQEEEEGEEDAEDEELGAEGPQEDEELGAEGPQVETDSQISSRTQQSQLSYKPMTPQAPPLPQGLGLTREPLLINGDKYPEGGPVEPPLVSSRPSSGEQQTGSRPQSASRAPHPPSEPRPASTTSQSRRRPPSQASVYSRGMEAETSHAAPAEGGAEQGQQQKPEKGGEEGQDSARGDEPEIEQLGRQGEMQRGDERVFDDPEGATQEKHETEEAEKTATPSAAEAQGDAGAGHQSRGPTPHPGEVQTARGPSAGSKRAGEESDGRAAEGGEPAAAGGEIEIAVVPAVKEDKAGRGGQAEAEPKPKPHPASQAPEDARSTNFTERAEDSLHVESDMKAKEEKAAAKDTAEEGAPTASGAGGGGASKPATKGASRQSSQAGSKGGSRPPTQPKKGKK